MKDIMIKIIMISCFLFSSLVYACGDNANAMVQGPFKDNSFSNGYICFQSTPDKRDIVFYQSYSTGVGESNNIIDTFDYTDAQVELMSVFFASVAGQRNVVVLLRWNVNYDTNGVQYPYYYEVKTYRRSNDSGYKLFLNSDKDPQLSGYQMRKNGKVFDYALDNAQKIKRYLNQKYSS